MSTLKIAVQKSGRLNEKSMQLLAECGIKLSNGSRKLKSTASNFPLEVLFLRDDDIPHYVADGVADLGILGRDVILETQRKVKELKPLGFSKCRLCLAVPREQNYSGLEYFEGKRIATSFPNVLSGFLKEKNIDAQIEEISGSVEIAPGIGLAEGICDLVSSGSTLLMNGLKEVDEVLRSEAVLIGRENLEAEKQAILDKFLFRMETVQAAARNKYVTLNVPNEAISRVTEILPGIKSPTVVPLATEGWSAMHSVLSEEDFWERIDQLKEAGAEGILVMPIEKMVS